MNFFPAIILFSLLSVQLHCQVITGKIVDSSNMNPLEYVSIGIIGTPLGTLTNAKGEFGLEVKGQSNKAIVRFSMIGFMSQLFSLEELSNKKNVIRLVRVCTYVFGCNPSIAVYFGCIYAVS